MQAELDIFFEQSQLVWWTVGAIPDINIEELLPEVDRILQIGRGEDVSWILKIEEIFEPEENIFITEQDILKILGRNIFSEGEPPIVLIRPRSSIKETLTNSHN